MVKIYKKFKDTVKFAEMRIDPKALLILTIVFTIVAVVVGWFLFDITLSILLALLVLDLGFGLPFYLASQKIKKIEEKLPDVLHHMGTTLKTGGTIEVALREVSRVEYGPITKGVKNMLREINEGKNFEEAFSSFAISSRSELMQRAAIIIIAARKSGGALLETLTAMAEDIRALYRLKRERTTKTFLQFLFILVAGCIIAPFVFGIVKSVLEILIQVGGGSTPESLAVVVQFDFLFKAYVILESGLSILGAVQVREGNISKAAIYIPIGVIISYVIYVAVAASFLRLIGG